MRAISSSFVEQVIINGELTKSQLNEHMTLNILSCWATYLPRYVVNKGMFTISTIPKYTIVNSDHSSTGN